MIESKINSISGKTVRSSIFLSRSLLESNRIERNLEKKSLILKRRLVEERGRTLKAIASRSKETGKEGVLGGALGLLGLGGGGGLLRRGLRRTPSSPNQLLRMQKGTSNLSRVGRLGKLARPLAVVGTGLDFIGRRAEGQSNVQAGVGAAGGLAGSLAGAKIGASLGTVAGPIGTLVGGAGGAIIGGLVGGNFADLFTGANRRRQFEEERSILRSQKTLFSEALDDFDDVLDKFEDVSIGLAIGRGRDDDEEGGKRKRPRLPIVPPKPTTPFLQRPAVKVIGTTLAIAGATVLAIKFAPVLIALGAKAKILLPAFKKSLATKGFSKLTLEKQLRVIAKEIGREKLIKRMSKAFEKNKNKIRKGEKDAKIRRLKKAKKDRENLNKRLEEVDDPDVMRDLADINDNIQMLQRALREGQIDQTFQADKLRRAIKQFADVMADMLEDGGMSKIEIDQLIKDLKKFEQGFDIFKDQGKNKPKDVERLLRQIDEIIGVDPNKVSAVPDDQRLDLGVKKPTGSSEIALAPIGNIFLLGGVTNNQQQSPTIINENNNNTMTTVNLNPYRAVAQQVIFESSLTA